MYYEMLPTWEYYCTGLAVKLVNTLMWSKFKKHLKKQDFHFSV